MGNFSRARLLLVSLFCIFFQSFDAPELPELGDALVLASRQAKENRVTRAVGLTVAEQQQIVESLVERMSDLIVTSFKLLNHFRRHLSIELPPVISEEKLTMIGDFMAGMFVLADELELMKGSIAKIIAKMSCMTDKPRVTCTDKQWQCSTKIQCLQSIMKDLFGYVEFIGKKRERYENKGILDPIFDIMFTGYTIKGQKRRALVPLWFEILGIPQKQMYDIILAIQEMRQVLRLVATLTLETESSESEEEKQTKTLLDKKQTLLKEGV